MKEKKKTQKVQTAPVDPKAEARKEAEAKKAANRAKAAAGRATVSQSSSWTGKLPATLLNEHCQKLKWERVVYDAKKVKDGFIVTVDLGQKNPKTNEVEHVRFTPPSSIIFPQETALEARHYAATYALHRIASHKNMKMILPGNHKDLWAKLDDEKKKVDAADRDRIYASDPFQAQRDYLVQRAKKKEEHAKNLEKQQGIRIQKVVNAVRKNINEENKQKKTTDETPKNDKSSEPAPKRVRFNQSLSMAKDVRIWVEKAIRQLNGFQTVTKSTHLDTKSDIFGKYCRAMESLGFAKVHAEEALSHTNSLGEAIEWLIIHMPEDDLPGIFTKTKNIGAKVTLQSNALQVEYAIREIKSFGYAEHLAHEAMSACNNSKPLAMARLANQLVYGESSAPCTVDESPEFWSWDEEIAQMKEMYDLASKKLTLQEDRIDIQLECEDDTEISITYFKPDDYPRQIPGIGIRNALDEKTPKYILLSAAKFAADFYAERVKEGDPSMMFFVTETIRSEFPRFLKHPMRLSDISTGVFGVLEKRVDQGTTVSTDSVKVSSKKHSKQSRIRLTQKSSKDLKDEYDAKVSQSSNLKSMLKSRKLLPAWKKASEILDIVSKNQIVLITGETGSGKSTQVVQFILDEYICANRGKECNIICTQPRRISAMGLAQRVASERDTLVGDVVGYSIRGETKASPNTMIRFITTGVLLRMLQSDPASALDNISHVVIDEVHEKSLDTTYLLILLRRLSKTMPSIKIILMSATVDPKQFFDYFGGAVGYTHIEGRTFPVKDLYLDDVIKEAKYVPDSLNTEGITSEEVGRIIVSIRNSIDYRLIATLVEHIDGNLDSSFGSILIFMSGAAEIDNCISALRSSAAGNRIHPLPLHASLSPSDQRKVFMDPPKGKRKIVVCTNIAETSITIPDAVAVIDSGRVKQTFYDADANVVKLIDTWASQAEVTQRRGRAGRVRSGTCYKLYTRNVQENDMPEHPAPEIKRAPLEQLYLSVKAMGIKDPERFLAEAIDPPETGALNTAKATLIKNGVLDYSTDELTALGKHVSTIPADIKCAKLMILSSLFGCLTKGLTIAAILSLKSPFVSPREKRDEVKAAIKSFGGSGQGDLLAFSNAYDAWIVKKKELSGSAVRRWCSENFLSPQALQDISSTRRQLFSSLQEIRFAPFGFKDDSELDASYNIHSNDLKLVRSIIGAAMSPNIAEVNFPQRTFKTVAGGTVEQDVEAAAIKYYSESERVFTHPSSLLFGYTKYSEDERFVSYSSRMVTAKPYISGITPLSIYGIVFFSDSVVVDSLGSGIVVKDWVGLKCWPRVAVLVKILRHLFNYLLEEKFNNPGGETDIRQNEIVNIVNTLIQTDGNGYR
ncbi:putative ATP-dependent RNA helicase YLR419W [Trichomonascus vanleenenianus]|uniref:RNA helicase n=1 Tax=Trichomonascus vanleenenianus TaxID=2268995 RepID=UPI003EC98568